jgi:phosphatidylglycerol---prolipoprotein diacylglyceryl transferase
VITLAAWLHDLSPFLVRFTQDLGLRWYGLSYAVGFLVGWLMLRWFSRRGVTPLSEQRVSDAMLILIAGVVVGGRLGYILVYDRAILTSFSDSFPFWGVFQLNKGGMASHGGMLGVLIATWFIARGPRDKKATGPAEFPQRVPWLHVWDLTAIACAPGLFFGRIANFINGELLGKIIARPGEPGPWWAVKFPQERYDWWMREGLANVDRGHAPALSAEQFTRLDRLLQGFTLPRDPDPSAAYDRMLALLQSSPSSKTATLREQLGPLLASRHPSQLYQAAAEGLLLGAILLLIWLTPRRPGIIAAWFLIVYGVFRVLTEFYRLPDSHLAVARPFGLSLGQWLSVLMVVLGSVLLASVLRRKSPVMGGIRSASRA